MIEFNIIIAMLLSNLGIIAGLILAKHTEEELEPGKKYWFLIEKTVLLAIILVPAIFLQTTTYFYLIYAVMVVGLLLFKHTSLHYLLLGVYAALIFPISLQIFFSVLVLVFFYGMVKGTVKYYLKELNYKSYLPYIIYMIPIFILIP